MPESGPTFIFETRKPNLQSESKYGQMRVFSGVAKQTWLNNSQLSILYWRFAQLDCINSIWRQKCPLLRKKFISRPKISPKYFDKFNPNPTRLTTLVRKKNTNLRINFACTLFSDCSFDTRETCTNTLQASRNVVQNSTFDCDTVCGFVSTGAGGQSTVTLSCQGSRPYLQYSLAYIVGHYGWINLIFFGH